MSTTEAIIEKVSALPPEKQEEVLQYVESLAHPQAVAKSGEPYCSLRAVLSMNLDGPGD